MSLPAERYIGDGVYASFDGYQIWVRTLEGDRIALEPEVLQALDEYRTELNAHFARSKA